jgi:hypothetical protein
MPERKDEPNSENDTSGARADQRNDADSRGRNDTRSGQEAVNDAPGDHSHEHHSGYGGGGTNGGATKE